MIHQDNNNTDNYTSANHKTEEQNQQSKANRAYKVLQFGKFYYPDRGGIQYFMYELTNAINIKNVTCDVLCSNRDNVTVHEINELGYKITRTASFGTFASTSITPELALSLYKAKEQYDIITIHLQDPMANLAYLLVELINVIKAKSTKTKLVVYWHHDIIKQKYLLHLYKPFLNMLLKRADVIVASTKEYAEGSPQLRAYLNKTKIVPIGINPERISSHNTNLPDRISSFIRDKKVVLSIGRLVYYKGFDVLIHAASLLPDDLVVIIIGNGPLQNELTELIEKSNLENKVMIFNGASDGEVGAMLEACKAHVLPSVERTEAFGLVQLEAMSKSKPCISTIIPGSGTHTIAQNGVSGFSVPYRDYTALANAIVKLVNHPEYDKFCLEARKRFENNFHIDIIAEEMLKVYDELMAQGS